MDNKKEIAGILDSLEIEALLREGRLSEAYDCLNVLLEKEPSNASAWYLLGNIYRRQELWGDAINAYNKAKLLNPSGPAAAAVDSIYEILEFRNTEMMNP
ncbi:MAG: tetratricopeptide repeat protein [Bacteroidales bacterium]|jgi:cytochrome c-type biogenesis protein CcmH/NrfG|nr:tetratricopeptide repeat protein [Bacteroidales bacterium]